MYPSKHSELIIAENKDVINLYMSYLKQGTELTLTSDLLQLLRTDSTFSFYWDRQRNARGFQSIELQIQTWIHQYQNSAQKHTKVITSNPSDLIPLLFYLHTIHTKID